jgi:predicted glycoside hydrolase/deacetylase ChbG (UPF0249 family)
MPEAVRLVVRADDAGSCISANEAVEAACDAGTARNVSLMVPGPAFDDAARRFAGRTEVCVGLHVTLNAEWAGPKWGPILPPSRVSTLVDDATRFFTPYPMDLQQRGFSVAEAIAEVEAQLAFARAAGLMITYLDEHMGVGWLPGLRDALAALARREGLIDATILPLSGLPRVEMPAAGEEDAAESLVNRWLAALDACEPGTYLLVTHPGKDAPDMQAFYVVGGEPGVVAWERDQERQALTRTRFREGCAARSVSLLRYDEVVP